MTQTPGSVHTSGTDLVAQSAHPTNRKSGAKRFARVAAAGALSFGMMSVFAFPAYATPEHVEGLPDGFASSQKITTAEVADVVLALEAPVAEIDTAEIERQETAAAEAAAAAAAEEERQRQALQQQQQEQQQTAVATVDLPAGAGASGLVDAAVAQLGVYQDCTALVEKALRAIGFGVGDLGTQVWEYAQYGQIVTDGAYAPGDILIWSGRHVAIYIGNGQAVHGGFNGNQTVISSAFLDGTPSGVVRVG